MSFPRFVILMALSVSIALCLFLQVVFIRLAGADERRLAQTEQALQQGELCRTRLVQIVNRTAQVAQQQQDQALRDLLARQGFQIKLPAVAPAPAALPVTH